MAMTTPTILWKRFWCPLGQAINCGDSGRDFLSDPEHDLGRLLNPNVFSLDQLLDKPCLILCGEPGMGKSKTIELARQTIVSRPGADQNPLWINFRDIPTEQVFHRKTFETAKWKTWLESDCQRPPAEPEA